MDHYLIARMDGVELRLHEPRREGVALKFDRPWEGGFSCYTTVIKDGATYRMYYRGLPIADPRRQPGGGRLLRRIEGRHHLDETQPGTV